MFRHSGWGKIAPAQCFCAAGERYGYIFLSLFSESVQRASFTMMHISRSWLVRSRAPGFDLGMWISVLRLCWLKTKCAFTFLRLWWQWFHAMGKGSLYLYLVNCPLLAANPELANNVRGKKIGKTSEFIKKTLAGHQMRKNRFILQFFRLSHIDNPENTLGSLRE